MKDFVKSLKFRLILLCVALVLIPEVILCVGILNTYESRAISIREAARLQTFPDTFIFEGSKDSQYQQVGNAVPPFLSNAIARSLVKALDAEKK